MAKIVKAFDGGEMTLDPGSRTVLAVISTDAVDRDGEVVSPKGMRRKNYSGNPVVLVNHDKESLPVGKALWVKADANQILAKYYVSDKTQEARDIFGLLQDGVLNAHSISFIANYASKPTTKEINERPELADAKRIYRDWELVEFSIVGIPANPEALTMAVSKGYAATTLAMISPRKEGEAPIVVEKPIQQIDYKEAICQAARRVSIDVDISRSVEAAMKRL